MWGAVLGRLKTAAAADGPLVPLSHRAWAAAFERSGWRLKLEKLGPPVLYQLRHGGASHEALTGFRPISGIKHRGRWLSDTSVRRYEKGGRVNQVLSEPPEKLRRHADACALRIGSILCGTSPPLRLPALGA